MFISIFWRTTMRDTRLLNKFFEQSQKKWKEMQGFINLKKEVDAGANGTQKYVIKEGVNKGKIAKK